MNPRLQRALLGSACLALASSCVGKAKDPTAPRVHRLVETVGIETAEDTLTPIFPAGTPVPATNDDWYSTAVDLQKTFQVRLAAGTSARASEARTIMNLVVPLEKPGPRAVPQIRVRLDVTADGVLSVHAQEKGSTASVDRTDLKVAVAPE